MDIKITQLRKKHSEFKRQIRRAFADYKRSEGCSCCENIEDHKKALETISKLLNVPKYKDGSGYDYSRYSWKK